MKMFIYKNNTYIYLLYYLKNKKIFESIIKYCEPELIPDINNKDKIQINVFGVSKRFIIPKKSLASIYLKFLPIFI